jgi:ribose transport system permease protein
MSTSDNGSRAPGMEVAATAHHGRSTRQVWATLSPRNIGLVYIIIILIVCFSIAEGGTFASWQTLKNILNSYSLDAILAMALVIPLAVRTFDLSIGGNLSLTSVVCGYLATHSQLGTAPMVLIALSVALGIGLVNAGIVVIGNVDSFIGTLAMGFILDSIALAVSGGNILSGRLSGPFGNIATLQWGGFEITILYLLVIMVVMGIVLDSTRLGSYMYATGFNIAAAKLAGIRTREIRAGALVLSALLAGFAGVLLAAQFGAADPTSGDSYLIPAFSAVFLGATQFRHGRFNPWGTVLAVMMLATATQGLVIAGAASWLPQVFEGIVLIIAVAVAGYRRRVKVRPAATDGAEGPAVVAEDDLSAGPSSRAAT